MNIDIRSFDSLVCYVCDVAYDNPEAADIMTPVSSGAVHGLACPGCVECYGRGVLEPILDAVDGALDMVKGRRLLD